MNTCDDNLPDRAEASAPAFPMTSADRARFWARMNRCLEDGAAPADDDTTSPAMAPVPRRTTDDHA